MYELVAILCTFLMASGQIAIKMGLTKIGGFLGKSGIQSIVHAITNPLILLGIFLYLVASITWLWVLSNKPLSYIYPVLALTYAFALIGSSMVLHEHISLWRWIGVAVISAGIFLISRS